MKNKNVIVSRGQFVLLWRAGNCEQCECLVYNLAFFGIISKLTCDCGADSPTDTLLNEETSREGGIRYHEACTRSLSLDAPQIHHEFENHRSILFYGWSHALDVITDYTCLFSKSRKSS